MRFSISLLNISIKLVKFRAAAVQPEVWSSVLRRHAEICPLLLYEHIVAQRREDGNVEVAHFLEMLLARGKTDV